MLGSIQFIACGLAGGDAYRSGLELLRTRREFDPSGLLVRRASIDKHTSAATPKALSSPWHGRFARRRRPGAGPVRQGPRIFVPNGRRSASPWPSCADQVRRPLRHRPILDQQARFGGNVDFSCRSALRRSKGWAEQALPPGDVQKGPPSPAWRWSSAMGHLPALTCCAQKRYRGREIPRPPAPRTSPQRKRIPAPSDVERTPCATP
jgi:hypothetical protein